MSFFGFESNDLEKDKRQFLDGGPLDEDVPEYTWGADNYNGPGNALQERGDNYNDETFGGDAPVGKDFDFSQPVGGNDVPRQDPPRQSYPQHEIQEMYANARPAQTSRPSQSSLESRWDDRSVSSLLPRMSSAGRSGTPVHQLSSSPSVSAKFSPFAAQDQLLHEQQGYGNSPQASMARTVEEVEAEMRAAYAQQSRGSSTAPISVPRGMYQQAAQQQQQVQQRSTPPPRMHPHAQSPRFHQQQQQQALLQQHQIQQQLQHHQLQQQAREQQQLLELQEQLRMEELERQLRAQQLYQLQQVQTRGGGIPHQRQNNGPTLSEVQAAEQLLRRRQQRSPAAFLDPPAVEPPFQQNLQYLPQDIQMQQRLLAEAAQIEFLNQLKGSPNPLEQEALRTEAMRKIMEAERMEDKRRRKQAKLAHMSRYNEIMTQSDKDFITRIQVSQLVTQDPYAEDYYAQVFNSNLRSRFGANHHEEHVLKFGASGGVGVGLNQKGGGRRANALQKMEAQVERIVQNARLREKEKGLHSLHTLQGALGKTSGRSYKAAPRQLLQVELSNDGGDTGLHDPSKDSDPNSNGIVKKDPLTYKESLAIVERLYEITMHIDQHRLTIPTDPESNLFPIWEKRDEEMVNELWDGWRVMVTLETSKPHPFISLLVSPKGKKLLARDAHILGSKRMLTMLTLLVACFSQLDVVKDASVLYDASEATDLFLATVMQTMMLVVARINLTPISGLLELLLKHNDILAMSHTRPVVALLTIFLSRVEDLKQTTDLAEVPSPEELDKWQNVFNVLFHVLAPHLLLLFPSTRAAAIAGTAFVPSPSHDLADQQVWQLLAAFALHSNLEQQQVLVSTLREKILENVASVNKGWVGSEEESAVKLANINIFLHALGLDSSQVVL